MSHQNKNLKNLENISRGHIFFTKIASFSSWISNYIHIKLMNVIANPCPKFNGGVARPMLKNERK